MEDNTHWFRYLTEHHDDIRSIVEQYSPELVDKFDQRYMERNRDALDHIMNDAWFNAPDLDARDVYSIPGFTEMCNLLDGTVDSWSEGLGD